MDKPQVFIDITQSELAARAQDYCERGWRFANLCGATVEGGVELIYSFSDDYPLENLRFVTDLTEPIASVSESFPNAFFFENETHDLFGVSFSGISIDYDGTFYAVTLPRPMNPLVDKTGEKEGNSVPSESDVLDLADATKADTAKADAAKLSPEKPTKRSRAKKSKAQQTADTPTRSSDG